MPDITGFHAVEELLRSGKARGRIEYSEAGPRVKAILELAARAGVKTSRISKDELERRHPGSRGLVFHADGESLASKTDLEGFLEELEEGSSAVVLVLDHLSDPHNLGAILRSADQFSADLVLLPQARSVRETETVMKASAGAAAWVPQATVPNLPRAVERLKEAGFWIYAADMEGDPLWTADLASRSAFILGAEGKGVSRLLAVTADQALSIPSSGHVDSLNVSVAAGIFLYEAARRRLKR